MFRTGLEQLVYAHDAVLVAEPRGDLLSIVDDFESGCDRMCLNINVEKNKVFVVRRKHRAGWN